MKTNINIFLKLKMIWEFNFYYDQHYSILIKKTLNFEIRGFKDFQKTTLENDISFKFFIMINYFIHVIFFVIFHPSFNVFGISCP